MQIPEFPDIESVIDICFLAELVALHEQFLIPVIIRIPDFYYIHGRSPKNVITVPTPSFNNDYKMDT